MTTGTACAWSAAAEAGWVALASSDSTGSGTLAFMVAPNGSSLNPPDSNVATQSVALNQAWLTTHVHHVFHEPAFLFGWRNRSVSVTAPSGCAWSTTSDVAWVTPGAGGTASADTTYTVASNATSPSCTGTLTVAGTPVTITQAAVSCTFTTSPTNTSSRRDRRNRKCRSYGTDWLQVDRHEQRRMDYAGRRRHWLGECGLHRREQCHLIGTHRHAHRRRQSSDYHAGRRRWHLPRRL